MLSHCHSDYIAIQKDKELKEEKLYYRRKPQSNKQNYIPYLKDNLNKSENKIPRNEIDRDNFIASEKLDIK